MSIILQINQKQIANKMQMHYLPAKIDGDGGEAKVETYFNNYTQEENAYFTNALRGYPLKGVELDVPANYKGVVFQEYRIPLDEYSDRLMRVSGAFDKFYYWNYDKVPSNADNFRQAVQIIDIGDELCKPVSLDDITKEIEMRKSTAASKENLAIN